MGQNVVRPIRWLRLWNGHPAGSRDDKRDEAITQGQRIEFVRRGVAEWADEPQPKKKRNQRESAAETQ